MPTEPTDFETLVKRSQPSRWLAAPAGLCARTTPDADAPTFDAPPERVAEAVKATLEAWPNTKILVTAKDGLGFEALTRTPGLKFKDLVTARVLKPERDGGPTPVALYSRSTVGYWDMGVNRKRVQALTAEIRRRLAA
ncbi:MAG: DUF1499 domain-containing protein [Azospirillaceae bacterium]